MSEIKKRNNKSRTSPSRGAEPSNHAMIARRWKRKKRPNCCYTDDEKKPIDASVTLKASDRGKTLLVNVIAEQKCGIAHIDITIVITDARESWSKEAIKQDYTCDPAEYPNLSRQWYFAAGSKKGMGDSRYAGKLPVTTIVDLQVFALMNVTDCCGHTVTREYTLNYRHL